MGNTRVCVYICIYIYTPPFDDNDRQILHAVRACVRLYAAMGTSATNLTVRILFSVATRLANCFSIGIPCYFCNKVVFCYICCICFFLCCPELPPKVSMFVSWVPMFVSWSWTVTRVTPSRSAPSPHVNFVFLLSRLLQTACLLHSIKLFVCLLLLMQTSDRVLQMWINWKK